MYKINLYRNLDWLYNIVFTYYIIKYVPFLLFINSFYFTNKKLLELKILIDKESSKSFILNTKIIKKIFRFSHFSFNSGKIWVIAVGNLKQFLNILSYFYLMPLSFSYLKSFSNIISSQMIINWNKLYETNKFVWALIIFKVLMYIIILILYFLYTLIRFLLC